jgi:hypothetical protein
LNSLITEYQLFAPISVFVASIEAGKWLFEHYETYQKMGFRNRYQVKGPHGAIDLTVPLKGGRDQKAPISSVEIDAGQCWAIRHLRTLESCYNRSPFFDYYKPELCELLFRPWHLLVDLDFAATQWALAKTGWQGDLSKTEGWVDTYHDGVTDMRNKWKPASRQQYPAHVYQQTLGEHFEPNLSILDLLFNKGPQTTVYLKTNAILIAGKSAG